MREACEDTLRPCLSCTCKGMCGRIRGCGTERVVHEVDDARGHDAKEEGGGEVKVHLTLVEMRVALLAAGEVCVEVVRHLKQQWGAAHKRGLRYGDCLLAREYNLKACIPNACVSKRGRGRLCNPGVVARRGGAGIHSVSRGSVPRR